MDGIRKSLPASTSTSGPFCGSKKDSYFMKSETSRADSIAGQLIKWRSLFLALAAVSAVGAFFLSRQLDFDRSIESMFSPDDPILKPYQELKQNFVGNEIVLAVYEDPNFLSEDGAGIERLATVAKQLKSVDGVLDILSLAEVNRALEIVYKPVSILKGDGDQKPIVDPKNELAKDFLEIFEGYTHSADGKTVSIVCLLDPSAADTTTRKQTISRLRIIMQRQSKGNLTGEPVLVSDGFEFVEQDGRRLGQTSILLLSLVIVVCFRSFRWVVIPIAVVYWSLWISRSIIVLCGLQMSMVSSMLTAIVTVIAVATVIHLIVRYREARSEGKTKEESIHRALSLLIVPIFWACVTDAAGFSALLFAETGPVRDFGLMMTIASLCVFLGIVLIVPGLSLLGSISFDPQKVWGESNLKSALRASTGFMKRRAKICAALISVAFVVVSAGIFRLKVESDFTKNFKSGTQIAIAYEFVEERMGGAGVLDVVVPAPHSLSDEYFARIEALENELRQISIQLEGHPNEQDNGPALNKVVSLADLDRASRGLNLPSIVTAEMRYQAIAQVMPTFATTMRRISPGRKQQDYLRIMLRTSQRGSAEYQQELIRRIDEVAKKHFPASNGQPAAETTGIFVLLANLVDSLLADQLRTFVTASIFIFLVMFLALRSLRLAIIAMVPNIVPILMLMGALGWFNIKLNMGAVMIAAVSIGLSIDSSIHYLWAYKRWRSRGFGVFESIQHTQHRVGRAAMYSTLALVAGFSTLCFSQFVPTVYFGGLVSLSMCGGLFGNLVVLPIILLLTFGDDSADKARSH